MGGNKAILELVTKANVPAGATQTGSHGQPLVSNEGAAGEFYRLVLEKSVIGRMAGNQNEDLQHFLNLKNSTN